MRRKYGLSETFKIHVITSHFKYFFDQTGHNFSDTNGERVKSGHSTLRIHEERFKFHLNRKIGTPLHGKISKQSLTFYNSKRAILTPFLAKVTS